MHTASVEGIFSTVFLYRIHVPFSVPETLKCLVFRKISITTLEQWVGTLEAVEQQLELDKANLKFRILFRRLSTTIVAVTMEPNPDKLKENVTLNFRHLKVTPAIRCRGRLAPISLKKLSNWSCSHQVADGKRLCVFWTGFGERKWVSSDND